MIGFAANHHAERNEAVEAAAFGSQGNCRGNFESARAIMALTLDGLAIGNGILTVEHEAQAIVRADPAQADKGGDAAKAALALLALKQRFS